MSISIFSFVAISMIVSTTSQRVTIMLQNMESEPVMFTFHEDEYERIHPQRPSRRLIRAIEVFCSDAFSSDQTKRRNCFEYLALHSALKLRDERKRAGELYMAFKDARSIGTHGLTPRFFDVTFRIFNPQYGTEAMGPLLHSLVRFHRPQRVVELGYGYTTPFIAQGMKDNVANAVVEAHYGSAQATANILYQHWYEKMGFRDGASKTDVNPVNRAQLHVVDDSSQRGDEKESEKYAAAVENVLDELELSEYVSMYHKTSWENVHTSFKDDSIDMIWNDAHWNPEFFRLWWPLLRKDGGILLLHNVVGNTENGDRWCAASPEATLRSVYPDEQYEIMTHMEPHKVYQGSVSILRRIDPIRQPTTCAHSWGMDSSDTAESRRQRTPLDARDK